MSAAPTDRLTPTLVWLMRLAWITLPLTAGPAIAGALDGRSTAVRLTSTVVLWVGWFAATVAMFVPTAVSLTAVRLIAPAAPAAVVVVAPAGASAGVTAMGLVAGVLATAIAFTGEVGRRFVQGSAYGDESRFPLRPPTAVAFTLLPLGWLLTAGGLGAGGMLVAARRPITGVPLLVLGAVVGVGFARRVHRLTRRFVVFVPSGFVIHDHFVLADTAMFRRIDVAGFGLAEAVTDAADLTGRASGPPVIVTFRDSETVVLAGTLAKRNGTAIHLRSATFTPTRPGAFLAEATRRGHRITRGGSGVDGALRAES